MFVIVLTFDCSNASDTVSHKIVGDKLKSTSINPYTNWTIHFLENSKQRVVGDWMTTNYVDINIGVLQFTQYSIWASYLYVLLDGKWYNISWAKE